MNVADLLRVLKRKWFYLLIIPVTLAGLVFYLTRNEEKEYSSSVTIYTGIASGYKITSEENPRLDHNAVNNSFDNLLNTLKSRETIEEAGIRLLASHLVMDKPDPAIISNDAYYQLKVIFPEQERKGIVDKGSVDNTIVNLYKLRYDAKSNIVKRVLAVPNVPYNPDFIQSKMTAKRKDLSDMMEITYSANDPGICQNTLRIISEVFIRRYKDVKQGEIKKVVEYFTDQTNSANNRLKAAEEKLKQFSIRNKIINYDDQARELTSTKQQIINNIENEKMTIAAAEATVKNLDEKINMRKDLIDNNQKIVEKRKRLAELNYKIANAEMQSNSQESDGAREEAEVLKEEIRNTVTELNRLNFSQEGIANENLITQWLNNILLIEEGQAKLKVLEQKLSDFDSQYFEYAPLSAELNRLKREVGVAEKDYMYMLHALNTNKQHQQNLELQSSLKIIDQPYYPEVPKASKRIMLIVGAFMAGLFLVAGFFIGRELTDSSIKNTVRAEKLTGWKVGGVMPMSDSAKNIAYQYLESSMMEQCISQIMLSMSDKESGKLPKIIALSSAKPEEGKTLTALKLADKLSEITGSVLYLYPEEKQQKIIDGLQENVSMNDGLKILEYKAGRNFMEIDSVAELVTAGINIQTYKYVIIEIPSLIENRLPIRLLKKADLPIFVLSANRSWSEADDQLVRMFNSACTTSPLVILNKVKVDLIKDILGKVEFKKSVKERKSLNRSIRKSKKQKTKV